MPFRSSFWEQPLLRSFFPLEFDNGGRFTSLEAYCSECNRSFPEDALRGTVVRPDRSVFIVEAEGFCAHCNIYQAISYSLHNDMSMTGRSPETGEFVRWNMRYEHGPVQRWLRRLLRRVWKDRKNA